MKIKAALVVVLLVGAIAGPAAATHGSAHPTFRTQDVFFHCSGPTKLYQANWTASLGNASSYMPWDTEAPTASVQEGAGCGSADSGDVNNPVYSPNFRGYFEGNLRDLTIRAHHLLLSNTRAGEPLEIEVQVEVDGVALFPDDGGKIVVTPEPSETGASEVFEFSVTNIGTVEEVTDADGTVVDVVTGGVAYEDGDGAEEHEIVVRFGLSVYGTVGAWVWDTTEVASGMTFNPAELAPAQAKATLPDFGY